MSKLKKGTWPANHTPDDFNCFGPVATKDGEFSGTMLCDMGCFAQGEVDSNKYYHAAVVQSKKDSKWYAYFEYGRVGATNPSVQFIEGPDKASAQTEYEKQLHAKNDKRGEWVTRAGLGKVLQPKAGKDCYLVRSQVTRSTGLPDARNISGSQAAVNIISTIKATRFDKESEKLLKDLNVTTVAYTRASMVNDSLPSQEAIDEARLICGEATKVANQLQVDTKMFESRDLSDLTRLLYSRIPKVKNRSDEKSTWFLTPSTIQKWLDDLDAFEAALNAQSPATVSNQAYDFHLEYLPATSNIGKWLHDWFPTATGNKHGNVRGLTIHNLWKIERPKDASRLSMAQSKIQATSKESPLFQPKKRLDLDNSQNSLYTGSKTCLLIHGTRTVNVSGILQSSLRLPKQLSNVSINGAMFGSGIYFADDWKKSAGYTSNDNSYWSGGQGKVSGRKSFMFLTDVALGNPYVASGPQGFQGPPAGHHSVFGKANVSRVMNNEFIIFDVSQFCLKYLVELSF